MMYLYLSKAPFLSQEGWALYKIGITKNIAGRKKSLSNSSVSGEFEMLDYRVCRDAKSMESKIFCVLSYYRYLTNREFFVFESDAEASKIVFETLECLDEGRLIDPCIVTPDKLLDQLQDRWGGDEYIV